MRFLGEALIVTALLSGLGVAQAAVGARELERLPPLTRVPDLPLSRALAALGLLLAPLWFGFLGRAIARAGAAPETAAAYGAGVGLVAGAAIGIAQVALQPLLFRDALLTYSLSDAYLPAVFTGLLLVAPLAGAATGAAMTWLGYRSFRSAARPAAA
jgi:hypothetical protein